MIKEDSYSTLQEALEQNPKMRKLKFVYPDVPVGSQHFQDAHQAVNPMPLTPRYTIQRNVFF